MILLSPFRILLFQFTLPTGKEVTIETSVSESNQLRPVCEFEI